MAPASRTDLDRSVPADVLGMLAFVGCANAVIWLPVLRDSPLRIPFGLGLALFAPGYALLAALFPARGERDPTSADEPTGNEARSTAKSVARGTGGVSLPGNSIDRTERVVLSVVTSAAIVVLAGLFASASPLGFRFGPVVLAVSVVTVCGLFVATVRRWRLAPDRRFRVGYREWLAGVRSAISDPDSRTEGVLNGALAIGVVLVIASVLYSLTAPAPGYTELGLLHQNETGALVVDDYPTEFETDQGRPLVVSIANHEHETTTYTVVVQLQRLAVDNNSVRVSERNELDRFRTTIEPNATYRRQSTITPTMTGRELRLAFLLYRGQPPATPTIENAYRETHLFVNVSTPAQSMASPVRPRAIDGAESGALRERTRSNPTDGKRQYASIAAR